VEKTCLFQVFLQKVTIKCFSNKVQFFFLVVLTSSCLLSRDLVEGKCTMKDKRWLVKPALVGQRLSEAQRASVMSVQPL
jgi:hypothetical protein